MRFLLVCAAVALASLTVAPARAQDTTKHGVTIGLTYDPSLRPGVAVLPVPGPFGDSIAAILQRDFDYSDRFTIVPLAGADPTTFRGTTPGADLNYPLFARLGAAAVIQASASAA